MLGPPPWHTKCTAKSSAVGVSRGAHGKAKAHGILPSGAGCVCTRQRAGSRQTASRAHNLSLSLSGRCCLLYFVMRRFSAHGKAFVVGLRRCARHSFFVVACVARVVFAVHKHTAKTSWGICRASQRHSKGEDSGSVRLVRYEVYFFFTGEKICHGVAKE
jgi:hypothetical protein